MNVQTIILMIWCNELFDGLIFKEKLYFINRYIECSQDNWVHETYMYNDRTYKFKICGKHLNPEFWFLLFKKHVSFYCVLGFLGCNMFFCPPNQTVQLLILKCVYFVLFLKASIKCFTSKYVIINQSFDQNRPFTSYQAYIWTTMELILSVWRICYKPTGLFENIFTT